MADSGRWIHKVWIMPEQSDRVRVQAIARSALGWWNQMNKEVVRPVSKISPCPA
jgi:hypothetical protein